MSNPVMNTMLRFSAQPTASADAPRADEKRSDGDEFGSSFSQALDQRRNDAGRPVARERGPEHARSSSPERPRNEGASGTARKDSPRTDSAAEGTAAESTDSSRAPATEEQAAASDAPSPASQGPADGETENVAGATSGQVVDPASLAALMPGVAALPAETAGRSDIVLSSDELTDTRNPNPGAYSLGKLIAEAGGKPGRNEKAAEIIDDKLASLASARPSRGPDAGELGAQALAARLQAGPQASSSSPGLHALQPEAQAAGLNASAFTPTAMRGDASSVTQLAVHTPASQAAWAEDVGNRVTWLVGRHESKAELVLTPAHLGKLEISIQVNGDQTTAHFVAASAAARDALEQALPRLREVLEQAGINLGQTNVSTSSEQRAQQDADSRRTSGGGGDRALDPATAAATSSIPAAGGSWVRAGSGMVDTFA